MKPFNLTSATLIVAALALGTALPAAAAGERGLEPGSGFGQRTHQAERHEGPRHFRPSRDRAPGLIGFTCSERGAERLEHVFVRLSHRLQLTEEQRPLFEDLRSSALTAQTGLADSCAAALPKPQPASGETAATVRPDLIDRLEARIAVEEARTAALAGVLPELEAFYDSLSDAQKASLDWQGQRRGRAMRHGDGHDHRSFHHHHRR